ncbi:hypothetical protein [Halovibrio salipaludis]|uniref:hypothetical protein n=1 Tax=Halovibrio salipaludis TaxID=2032626 RepID=UPI00117A0F70|nr:hypothetical protein [Halovibrio salipaludis]
MGKIFLVFWGLAVVCYLRLKFVVKQKEEGLYSQYFGNKSSNRSGQNPSRFSWYALKISCWDEGLDPKVFFWLKIHFGAMCILVGYTLFVLIYFAALVVGKLLGNG